MNTDLDTSVKNSAEQVQENAVDAEMVSIPAAAWSMVLNAGYAMKAGDEGSMKAALSKGIALAGVKI